MSRDEVYREARRTKREREREREREKALLHKLILLPYQALESCSQSQKRERKRKRVKQQQRIPMCVRRGEGRRGDTKRHKRVTYHSKRKRKSKRDE